MAMFAEYLDLIAGAGRTAITQIGLVDGAGTEIVGGSYARQAVTWDPPASGLIRPTADLNFDIPAGATVAGWRGFSAGGTNYGGEDLPAQPFTTAGTYTLLAASTSIDHNAV